MNDDLIEKAEEAITAVFNDTSVSRNETRENLEELSGMIRDFLNTLDDDE